MNFPMGVNAKKFQMDNPDFGHYLGMAARNQFSQEILKLENRGKSLFKSKSAYRMTAHYPLDGVKSKEKSYLFLLY